MAGLISQGGVNVAAAHKAEEALKKLVESAGLSSALVIDHSGYIIARVGKVEHVRPEELAVIAAGSFASYEMVIRAKEMTLDFHTKGVDNIHFVRLTSNVILLALFNDHCAPEDVRRQTLATAEELCRAIGVEETAHVKLGSVQYISSKLDELFK